LIKKFALQVFFLNIGRLTNQKNQKLLIDTFYNLKKKNKNLFLVIIGEGENRSNLLNQIKKLKFTKKYFFTGI
jgi:glycosyltransferase involved in cell wall biosynthesis